MMDTVWIQQSFPFDKYSFNFKDLIRLNTIREPLLILCCCCYCFNYQFLNQKLQTVGLTKSQGLGMQEQIQSTDELQMWTNFTGFNRLSSVCQVTETRACVYTRICFFVLVLFCLLVLNTTVLSRSRLSSYCKQQLKIKSHDKLLCFTVYHLGKQNKTTTKKEQQEKNPKQMKLIFVIKQSLITTTCF